MCCSVRVSIRVSERKIPRKQKHLWTWFFLEEACIVPRYMGKTAAKTISSEEWWGGVLRSDDGEWCEECEERGPSWSARVENRRVTERESPGEYRWDKKKRARFVRSKDQRKKKKYCLYTVLQLNHCSFINLANERKQTLLGGLVMVQRTSDSSTNKVLLDSSDHSEIFLHLLLYKLSQSSQLQ